MFDELESVVLTHDIDEYNLKEGDVGVIVFVYSNGAAYEVEFMTHVGRTTGVLTLTHTDLRSKIYKEIFNSSRFAGKVDYTAFGTVYDPIINLLTDVSNTTIVNAISSKEDSKTNMFNYHNYQTL